jgi:hypothetical protein
VYNSNDDDTAGLLLFIHSWMKVKDVYSQLDESEGDGREMRVDRCDVLCGG